MSSNSQNEQNQYIVALKKSTTKIKELLDENAKLKQKSPIAVVGMACRFPGGANNPELFWKNLQEGIDSVIEIPKSRWNPDVYFDENPEAEGKTYTKYSGLISDYESFDNKFFEISPVEAKEMDPQQRILLEVSHEALENAGINIDNIRGSRTGTYMGMHTNDHLQVEEANGLQQKVSPYSLIGNVFSVSCGRISYFYDFHGPSVPMNTACSSSITAIHGAISALNNKEIDMALAGGINLLLSPDGYIGLCKLKSLSKGGHCRAFDNDADGFVRGEGCGIIVLKRLSDAIADKDNILGIISGVAVGQDGKSNGIAAPNGIAQENIIKTAMATAGVSFEDIDWIETHGTGTPLGDPVEVGALTKVFEERKSKLYISSVKTNIGHLESAAGIASIIKVLLSLNKNLIPASLNFNKPNALIPWDEIPIEVAKNNIIFEKNHKKRVIGINSFGYNGSISHTLVEEAPELTNENNNKLSNSIFTLSAKNETSLADTLKRYIEYLQHSSEEIQNICYTSNISRTVFNKKFAVTAKSNEDLVKKLKHTMENPERTELVTSSENQLNKNLVFMFTGQGSQYFNMADTLYQSFPIFKEELDKCSKIANSYINKSIVDILYNESNKELISQAQYAQPIIFSIEYSIAKLLISFGLKPSLIIGHSIGEYAAVCISGILSLEDAIKIVCLRGNLMKKVTLKGKMVGVLTSEEKATELMQGLNDISIAAVNAPSNVTVSGTDESIEEFLKRVKKNKIFIEQLDISHAFHSVIMQPYGKEFYNEIKDIKFNKPQIPIIGDLNGELVKEDILNAEYWSKHIYSTIQFQKSIKKAEELGYLFYVEIGGTATLTGLAAQCIVNKNAQFFPTLRKDREALQQLNESIAKLYLAGVKIDWKEFHKPFNHKKVVLPNYAFIRKEFPSKPYPDHRGSFIVDSNTQQLTTDISTIIEKNKPIHPIIPMQTIKPSVEMVLLEIKELISQVSGLGHDEIENDLNLFSLGLDSLMLVQFMHKIEQKYQVEISMNDFLTELNTLNKISNYIQERIPEKLDSNISSHIILAPDTEFTQSTDLDIKQLFTRQLQIMEKQIEALNAFDGNSKSQVVKKDIKTHKSQAGTGNNRGIVIEEDRLSPQQKLFVINFINSFTKRTSKSKEFAQNYRSVMADWINSLNFRPTLKEILYPIVPERMYGANFIDIDGNKYIDIGMGRGANYLGHNPEFVTKAIEEQVKKGYGIGSQNYLAGKVASLISELTNCERITFSNTGTEAVMAAVRLARTKKGKNKIVKFAGAYHGTFDGVMVEGDEYDAYPMSPGTPQGMVEDIMVLNYGSNESLEIIEKHADELAAVLVEPVQSRNPSLQPKEFLVKLRKLTEEKGIILIFDEMITGFRIHPGGAQAYFNIQADICTYGKIPGGGLPIGIIAGKAKYLDAIDAGCWQYGDASVPPSETTVFGGTFCKHPLSMAAAHASMLFMKEKGVALQEGVNEKMKYFADTINEYFMSEKVPIKVHYFASQFRFISTGKYDLALQPLEMELFFNILMSKGVYTWERRICTLSIDHTYDDLNYTIKAIKETVAEIRQGGFTFNLNDSVGVLPESICYPISSHQARTYTLCQFDGAEKAYHITKALILEGELDIEKLQGVFDKIIRNHESLRTGFMMTNDEVVQVVYNRVDFKIEVTEAKNRSNEELLNAFIKPFNLEAAPLIRIGIVKLSAQKYFLILDTHHIVVDGYSLNILIPELVKLYNGEINESPSSDYVSFVNWEKTYRTTEKYLNQKDYWVNKLQGELPECELPLDFTRSMVQDFSGKTVYLKINTDKTNKIKSVAKKYALTDFMLLLGSFKVLVHKLTGLEDVVIGTPVLIRPGSKFDNAIGMFTNNMVLRSYPKSDKVLIDYFNEVKVDCLSSFSNMEFPFNDLVNNLHLPRSVNRNLLYSIMFVYEKADDRVVKFNNINTSEFNITSNNSLTDITFEIIEANNELNISVSFVDKLYKPSTIEHWGDFYLRIIDQLVEFAENNQFTNQQLSEINILDEAEKNKILYEFNNKTASYPKDKTIHKLFEEQVARTPDSIALKFDNKEMTYQELNERSNQLSRTLRDKGVKSDTIVGLIIERSFDMIISIIGVLKAGGAYLPIDPDSPENRKTFMLEDSKSKVLLSCSSEYGDLKYNGAILLLDDDKVYSTDKSNLPSINKSTDLSYIIYTSGTTGKPKGVMVNHSNVVSLMANEKFQFDFNSNDVWTMFHSYCFDFSVWEMYGALLYGGKLIIIPKIIARDSSTYLQILKNERVTILNQTPSSFYNLINEEIENEFNFWKIRNVIFGGEALKPMKLKGWQKKYPSAKIINMFGITETTVHVTYKEIGEYEIENNISNIGKPIPSLTTYILDKGKKLVPIGVPGELCVGGYGVARGYLYNPDLTQARFIDNPYNQGEKLYCSGDLAKLLPNGDMEYLGRIDHQVKIRGFRIELGEIEHQLLNIENIKEAIVIAKDDKGGLKHLVAYFVSKTEIDISDLRLKLSKSLTDYMIPSYFVQLENLPLTSNGKIDRKSLPDPEIKMTEYVGPSNEIEEKLVEIWSEELGIEKEKISVHSDFFELGGHSLKATIIISKAHKAFDVKVPLVEFFKSPTIYLLSNHISDTKQFLYKADLFENVETEKISL